MQSFLRAIQITSLFYQKWWIHFLHGNVILCLCGLTKLICIASPSFQQYLNRKKKHARILFARIPFYMVKRAFQSACCCCVQLKCLNNKSEVILWIKNCASSILCGYISVCRPIVMLISLQRAFYWILLNVTTSFLHACLCVSVSARANERICILLFCLHNRINGLRSDYICWHDC